VDGVDASRVRTALGELVQAVRENKQRLSQLDGAVGDGDHGINLNKGFSLWAEELQAGPGDLCSAFSALSRILLASIGGAMGPLYGMFFHGMAAGCQGQERIDAAAFGRMLSGGLAGVQTVSQAKVGDKTLMDVLLPAEEAYRRAVLEGRSFEEALEALARAAEAGRDSTRDLVARVGRASRLGERSRGALDAGAVSCALLLTTLAGSLSRLLSVDPA
jgi:dihydroxyacetone kinase phosphoprotein-dependent L subunit